MTEITNILEEVKGARTIGIAGHVNPDGDAIGSSVALGLYLRKMLPEARVDVFAEPFRSSIRKHMPMADEIRTDFATDVSKYDVFIAMDTASDRLGGAKDYFDAAEKKLNVDHHESNPGCGDANYIRPEASSTCELVYDLIDAIDSTVIDEPIARALYIGIITDTGVFKYSNTAPHTMSVAGDLLARGFDQTTLINDIFYKKSYLQNQILGRALLESMLIRNKTCIVARIDRRTMEFYQVTGQDMDGIVSQMMLTEGVEVAIFAYEISPMTYKVSLRSDGSVNVARIATFYGGGGHERAAGCTINASFHDIVNNISDSIDIQLAEMKESKTSGSETAAEQAHKSTANAAGAGAPEDGRVHA